MAVTSHQGLGAVPLSLSKSKTEENKLEEDTFYVRNSPALPQCHPYPASSLESDRGQKGKGWTSRSQIMCQKGPEVASSKVYSFKSREIGTPEINKTHFKEKHFSSLVNLDVQTSTPIPTHTCSMYVHKVSSDN